jgi:hypothetical protein
MIFGHEDGNRMALKHLHVFFDLNFALGVTNFKHLHTLLYFWDISFAFCVRGKSLNYFFNLSFENSIKGKRFALICMVMIH